MIQRLTKERAYQPSGRPRLWASEAGGCARKAMLRITGYLPTHPFPLQAREAMQNGIMFEDDTAAALREAYGERLSQQVYIGNDFWSCKADFVIDLLSDHPVIIEHKAVGEKWWNFNGSIPKAEHALQLLLYRFLYHQMHGVVPQVILFYRSWGHYAELTLAPLDMGDGVPRIEAAGEMDGEPYYKLLVLDPDEKRLALEQLYAAGTLPDPFDRKIEGLCTFKGEPSCPMYGHCWQ